jgi:hypothetical protein
MPLGCCSFAARYCATCVLGASRAELGRVMALRETN